MTISWCKQQEPPPSNDEATTLAVTKMTPARHAFRLKHGGKRQAKRLLAEPKPHHDHKLICSGNDGSIPELFWTFSKLFRKADIQKIYL